MSDSQQNTPPPAEGARLEWDAIPDSVRAKIEAWLGNPVVSAVSQRTGFSPGVAARLRTTDGRRVFLKAIGPEPNPTSPDIHRREARITALIPASAPVPRLLWSTDDHETGWVVLIFDEIEGQHPAQPWRPDELERVLDAIARLADSLTPSPLPPGVVGNASEKIDRDICGWRRLQQEGTQLDALAAMEGMAGAAAAGNTLLNFDMRADNMLLTANQVWFLDWPHACVGAAWIDQVFLAPSVAMQGGPTPETILARVPTCRTADPDAITAVVVALAGYFTHRALQPPPPGLPTLRAFQAAQGVIARQWVAERTGWR